MGYEYKSKDTALNGIYLWMQNTGYVKVTKNTQYSQDTSLKDCVRIMISFLEEKGIETPMRKGKIDDHKIAETIQPLFQQFVIHVARKFKTA